MRLSDIIKELELSLSLDIDSNISGINTLSLAKNNEISFFENPKYLKDLEKTKASAVLLKDEFKKYLPDGVIALVSNEPYLKLALLSKFFAPKPFESNGEDAIIGENSQIMPNVYIGKNTIIGSNVTIMSNSYIGDFVTVGDNTLIHPNVTIYRDCKVGSNVILHSGSVVGSDGFGFAHTMDGKHIKIYQNGNVVIGNDVEIGANTTIDRAVFGSTFIKDGVKIDNLVQIGHNCEIGEFSIIVAQSGISGSSILGRNVVMGGQSATAGHLKIGAFATVAARGGVTKSIEGSKTYSGFPIMEHKLWLKLQAKISKLLKKDKNVN
jgi:UDP-3-O-[3-hydroxymyristoyl] glucosamine N-acyltransferase